MFLWCPCGRSTMIPQLLQLSNKTWDSHKNLFVCTAHAYINDIITILKIMSKPAKVSHHTLGTNLSINCVWIALNVIATHASHIVHSYCTICCLQGKLCTDCGKQCRTIQKARVISTSQQAVCPSEESRKTLRDEAAQDIQNSLRKTIIPTLCGGPTQDSPAASCSVLSTNCSSGY